MKIWLWLSALGNASHIFPQTIQNAPNNFAKTRTSNPQIVIAENYKVKNGLKKYILLNKYYI